MDQDNKDLTTHLLEYAKVAAKARIAELVDSSKGAWKFLSESEGKLLWDHSPPELKKALEGMVAVNGISESSFAGLTSQVEVLGRIGVDNAVKVSDVNYNGFLHHPPVNKKKKVEVKHGLFHGLPEDPKITAVMAMVERVPATTKANSRTVKRQWEIKCQREEMTKEETLAKALYKYIKWLT